MALHAVQLNMTATANASQVYKHAGQTKAHLTTSMHSSTCYSAPNLPSCKCLQIHAQHSFDRAANESQPHNYEERSDNQLERLWTCTEHMQHYMLLNSQSDRAAKASQLYIFTDTCSTACYSAHSLTELQRLHSFTYSLTHAALHATQLTV